MRVRTLAGLLGALCAGCGGSDDAPSTGSPTGEPQVGAPVGTPAGTPTGAATGSQLPADPRPLTLVFSGALNETLVFDTPTCANYPTPLLINFRTFWRGSTHNAVLIAEVLGDFAGAGTYTAGTENLRVKLQTEAGSTLTFDPIAVDTAQGDTATLTIEFIDESIAFGSVVAPQMHGAAGAVTLAPGEFPIWCEAVEI